VNKDYHRWATEKNSKSASE